MFSSLIGFFNHSPATKSLESFDTIPEFKQLSLLLNKLKQKECSLKTAKELIEKRREAGELIETTQEEIKHEIISSFAQLAEAKRTEFNQEPRPSNKEDDIQKQIQFIGNFYSDLVKCLQAHQETLIKPRSHGKQYLATAAYLATILTAASTASAFAFSGVGIFFASYAASGLFNLSFYAAGVDLAPESFAIMRDIFKECEKITAFLISSLPNTKTQESTFTNFYEMLEISSSASPKEIKEAYIKFAVLYHPDKNTSASAEEKTILAHKFSEIAKAYDVLKDPQLKKDYDITYDNYMRTGIAPTPSYSYKALR